MYATNRTWGLGISAKFIPKVLLADQKATAHKELFVQRFLAKHKIKQLQHSPHCSVMVPVAFLFLKTKIHERVIILKCGSDYTKCAKWTWALTKNYFQSYFEQFQKHWRKFVAVEGNYFKCDKILDLYFLTNKISPDTF